MGETGERERDARVGDRQGRAKSPGRKPNDVVAALDLGTNNCRLLIARPAPGGFRVIDGFSRVVRLGQGIGESGVLSEAAIERTVDALIVCAAKMERREVGRRR